MSTPQDIIAAEIRCTSPDFSPSEVAGAILCALTDAGYELVELPRPVREDNGDEFWTEWATVGLYAPVVFDAHPDVVQLRDGAWCDEPLTPQEARDIAASLLAAARRAEQANG